MGAHISQCFGQPAPSPDIGAKPGVLPPGSITAEKHEQQLPLPSSSACQCSVKSDGAAATCRGQCARIPAGNATLHTAVPSSHGVSVNPIERLCRETDDGLAVLDYAALNAELRDFPQPVAVLYVSHVSPSCAFDTAQSSIGSAMGPFQAAPGLDAALTVRRQSGGVPVSLVFSAGQGSLELGCVLANPAAVCALQLREERELLSYLARSFGKDPGLKVLFQDIIKRLLQGQLHAVHHFVPGDFGSDRYFLSVRISPFVYRYSAPAEGGLLDSSSPRNSPGLGAPPHAAGGEGGVPHVAPAMILELDVPYEGKELAARLQRDYLMLSNIPSIVTMFDMAGRVLHQNRS
ncbi:hypothetical protein Agub_g10362, partial [Astrephomene gubernaculifera]